MSVLRPVALAMLGSLAAAPAAAQTRWLRLLDRDGGHADLELRSVRSRGGLLVASLRWFLDESRDYYTIERQEIDCDDARSRMLRVEHFRRIEPHDSLLFTDYPLPAWTEFGSRSLGGLALRLTCHVAAALVRPRQQLVPT